ncbi:alkaline phosphatase family protein [Novosphingobium beihaiensis]|uniref:Ectonucleotide pyrophosphatase/phosphodiesterase n=1 Tax=Novosphingobium beihaiensis TaxID=2930389 RepID=A0ABT0BMY6_9SPHN|nr:ectonucleotide pyrophosphatase/phosphodiesterase [Novosphingobium beihaiensis]MCJ2186409.1 ectonucleotide pyrophosphatase/phosphodiesterase [Novosphingobium beihaiensis]
MSFIRLLSAALIALLPALPAAAEAPKPPVVILVSIDGFRASYLDRGVTPHLSALADAGISAAMRPSFPSKTFPNHWALVTGKTPDHNGIVANHFEDPRRPGERFAPGNADPFWWNEAEPLWVTAEKAGIRTAAMFWPGSDVAWGGKQVSNPWPEQIGGTRPEDWQHYDAAVTPQQRVNTVLDWLRRPETIRPRFLTLYFDAIDHAGHEYGPDDPRTDEALAEADRYIGLLVQGLRDLHQPANLIVVADHGMAAVSSERVIALDTIADPALYRIVDTGPFAALEPTPGNEGKLAAALRKPHDHMQCWPRGEIPARLRYGSNPRVASYFCLAQVGWEIGATAPDKPYTGGAHGYDNAAPEMAALFIASGPAIAPEGRIAPFGNVDVAPLLRDLLSLPPAPDADGNDAPFRKALRH